MVELVVCKKDSYFDSVTLMTLSSKLKKLPGVGDAVVSMATTMNKELLENVGMLKGEAVDAGPNDLVVAIRAESQEQCDAAYGKIDELLHSTAEPQGSSEAPARTIREAKERNPDLGVAIVSVKGEFAAREARIALQNDMHVMLFSDNVSVEQERELKALAHEKGLLVMGPDCGTAILGGVGLCFANKMRQGSIGLAAASGTGLQEVCVLIDKLGEGISQALGTGGRDLSAEIGGMMMLDCIDLLDADPDTKVIVVVSKPPVEEVANKVRERLARCSKPVVVCFIAGKRQDDALDADEGAGMTFASSLEDAAYRACAWRGACERGRHEVRTRRVPRGYRGVPSWQRAALPARTVLRRHAGGRDAARMLQAYGRVDEQRGQGSGHEGGRSLRQLGELHHRLGRRRVHGGPAPSHDRAGAALRAHLAGGRRSRMRRDAA